MVHYPRKVASDQPKMVSFAQNAEDVMIDRVLQKSNGFFIDVGAFHPVLDSVTRHFSQSGWTGINIEPDPELFAEFVRDRTRDINLCCAVAATDGEAVLHRLETRQCSTISERRFALYEDSVRAGSESRTVPVPTLAGNCAQYASDVTIDFLKIDVEGAEREVIEGGDWLRFRPRLVIAEVAYPDRPDGAMPDWEPILTGAGYDCLHFDGINRYYLRAEDSALQGQFVAPVNYRDWYFSFRDMIRMQEIGETGRVIDQASALTLP
jgi:FkbM family methyltransferase